MCSRGDGECERECDRECEQEQFAGPCFPVPHAEASEAFATDVGWTSKDAGAIAEGESIFTLLPAHHDPFAL